MLLRIETVYQCPENTALGVWEQTGGCKAYQDLKTLCGRFGRDIYSQPATAEDASPLGRVYFQLNIFSVPHIHHAVRLQGSNSPTHVDWVCVL